MSEQDAAALKAVLAECAELTLMVRRLRDEVSAISDDLAELRNPAESSPPALLP